MVVFHSCAKVMVVSCEVVSGVLELDFQSPVQEVVVLPVGCSCPRSHVRVVIEVAVTLVVELRVNFVQLSL